MTVTNDAPGGETDLSGDGQDLVLWALSPKCEKAIRQELSRAGIRLDDQIIEDVAQATLQNVERHVRRNPDQQYDNVRAYGRRIVHNTIIRVNSGRVVSDLDLTQIEAPVRVSSTEVEDALRMHLEQRGGPLWLLASALAYVTIRTYPEVKPDGLPWPQAGAAPSVADGWPALWLGGVRDVFPVDGRDTRKRRRNQSVARVRERVTEAGRLALRDEA